MSIASEVTILSLHGIDLYLDGAELVIKGPRDALTPERLAWLRGHKPEILADLALSTPIRGVPLEPADGPALAPRPCGGCGHPTTESIGMCRPCEDREVRYHRLGRLIPRAHSSKEAM